MNGQLHIIPDRERIEESMALAKEYNAVFEYNDFYSPKLLDDVDAINELIDFYKGLPRDISKDTMHGAFLDVTVHSEDSLIRKVSEDRIRQSMDIAKRLGVHAVIVHTGRIADFRVDYYLNHWLDANERFFRKVLSEYPDIDIYMENMFDEAPDIMGMLAERMKDIPNFGICLDYAHGAITDVSCREWIRTLAPYVRHLHINDNDLVNDLHKCVGTGKIDWKEFNELIREYEINTSVLVEVRDVDVQKQSLQYMTENKIYPLHA